MDAAVPGVDLSPLWRLALLGALIALVPLAWVWLRRRQAGAARRLRALTLLTLFLTFDLVLFGAYTRLSDSGLGCPDWPGCYGNASPLGAHADIHAAQNAMPTGPVTHSKAWVEMLHRYLATAVGALITVLALASWRVRHIARAAAAPMPSPWWATATLVWVCAQGAFGALSVTLKLYPAIVTMHLLGGLGLLALLTLQAEAAAPRPLLLAPRLRAASAALAVLCVLQIALGGWVSSNYAVLACSDFPACQGAWWPEMDFARGYSLLRALGAAPEGGALPFAALTAIHYGHRLGAYVVLAALLLFAAALRAQQAPAARRWAPAFLALALWQLASGLGNVLLGWPLAVALAHTGGAAVLVVTVTRLLVRAHAGRPEVQAAAPIGPAAQVAS